MGEIATVALVVVVAGVALALLARRVDHWAYHAEVGLNLVSSVVILFAMCFVTAEVLSRKFFNYPIPGHLELSELLTPVVIFFALAYTQGTGGHVRMTLVLDRLPTRWYRGADALTLALSVGIYAVLTYFSATHAWRAYINDDVTMSPPFWPVWPSSAAVPLGLFFTTLRLYLQFLHAAFPSVLPYGSPHARGYVPME